MSEHGSYLDPLLCVEIADELGIPSRSQDHCPTCHGNNIFDDEVFMTVQLTDGRFVDACGPIVGRLRDAGWLRTPTKDLPACTPVEVAPHE